MSRFRGQKRNPNFGSGATTTSLRLETKLNAARSSGQMNLSGLGLDCIPPQALDLRAALLKDTTSDVKAWECYGEEMQTHVDLSDNPLGIIEASDLEKFTSVKKLRLRRCYLKGFAPPGSLAALTFLDIMDNAIVGEFALDDLPQTINEVHMSNNNITSLGPAPSLPSLTVLSASSNALASYPSLHSCPSLLSLTLNRNRLANLSRLPNSISALEMANNELTGVLDLGGAASLTSVDFKGNKLMGIVGVGKAMLQLDMSQNRVESLEDLFHSSSSPVQMKEFRARSNKIRVLPSRTFALSLSLTLLDLADNDLSDVPGVLGYLPNLTKISLEGNCLRGNIRPSMLSDVRVLKKSLRFRSPPPFDHPSYLLQDGGEAEAKEEKKRVAVGAARGALGGTGTLDLAGKNLKELPAAVLDELEHEVYDEANDDYFSLGSKVKTMNVSKNRIGGVDPHWFETLRGLTALDVSRNALRALPSNLATLRLQNLTVSSNPLGGIGFAFPGGSIATSLAENLAHLHASNCGVKSLPSQIFELRSLQTLDLSYNPLTDLSLSRGGWVVGGGLGLLSVLDLSNCKIHDVGDLPFDLKNKPKVTTLRLGNNELRSIPLELGEVGSLMYLDLKGNPQRAVRPDVLDRPCEQLKAYLRDKIGGGGAPVTRGQEKLPLRAQALSAPEVGGCVGGDIDKIQRKVDELQLGINNVHLTEMQKYSLKKQLAMEKSRLIKEKRRVKEMESTREGGFRANYE